VGWPVSDGGNKVFAHQAKKARGVLHFSIWDKWVLGAAAALGIWLTATVHWSVGIGLFVASALVLVAHRKLDHDRIDHLEILARARLSPPRWNLCERDSTYRRFPWR